MMRCFFLQSNGRFRVTSQVETIHVSLLSLLFLSLFYLLGFSFFSSSPSAGVSFGARMSQFGSHFYHYRERKTKSGDCCGDSTVQEFQGKRRVDFGVHF